MIEKFNGIIYLIVFLVHFIGTGVYAFQLIVGTKKFRERFQIDETASTIMLQKSANNNELKASTVQ